MRRVPVMPRATIVPRVLPSILLAGALIWGSAWIVSSALQSHLYVAVVLFAASALLSVTWGLHLPSTIVGVVWGASIMSDAVSVLLFLPGGLYGQAFVDFVVIISLAVASYLIGVLWSLRHLPAAEQVEALWMLADRFRRRN
jgi:hypothetical protein